MGLKQLQSWQRLLTRGASQHVRQFHHARPDTDAQPTAGPISRRRFMWGAAGATGLALAAGLWTPARAVKPKPGAGEPNPIPHLNPTPFEPIHFSFPGPADSTDPTTGHDPSLITDFKGFIGVADLDLTGTGTDTTTGETAPYNFHTDMRFMKGEFVGTDGRPHRGAFLFI
jgi:hypothetical protein